MRKTPTQPVTQPLTSAHPGPFGHTFRNDERGSVMAIFAIALPVLVGIAGLAVDYGRSTLVRRHLVEAADAAAIVATKAVGDGHTIADATSLAKAFWAANATALNAHVATPSITVTEVDHIVTTTVNYTASVDTTFGRITGVNSLAVDGTSVAQASSVVSATKTFNGTGGVWGDPHLVGADGHDTTFLCPRPSWYDVLSDGGVEVNIRCQSYPHYDMVSDLAVKLGAHTISLSSAMLSPTTMQMTAPGWTNQVTIDGVVYNPSRGTQQLAAWAEGTVSATIDTLDYMDTSYSTNSNHIQIETPQYTINLGFGYANGYGSWGWTTITAKNAGVCGVPGGLFGKTLGGVDDYTMTDFAVPTDVSTQPAFDRSACPVLTAAGVRLIK